MTSIELGQNFVLINNYDLKRIMSQEKSIFFVEDSQSAVCSYKGSTDKFSAAILTHLFCPHCARDPPHSFGYASGLPPCSAEKSTPIWRTSFYQRFLKIS